ncbi:MAG: valine--tRNA ligase [Chloroflexota bacterium]
MSAKEPGQTETPKAYEPARVEGKWYRFWVERGYFTPKIEPGKSPFVIIMPPPNVTGELHLGHFLTIALEDAMTRWHRMKGEPTLWLPGTDHAGIATQVIVEQQLAKKGLDRKHIGREKFEEQVWAWVRQCRQTINLQHQRFGASCDWTRERFTLDDGPARAVRSAFVRLYNKGLIYRGERLINWCPRCLTAISDLEVQHQELKGHLYYMRYPLAESDGFVTVATTRPETYLGDTAVAVNPADQRYVGLIGKKVVLPVINRVIPIIADSAVDSSFGTGAVKITPAHDPVDFEMAGRQHLPLVNIMNPDATLNENAGPYASMGREAARKKILEDFEKAGLLEKITDHVHMVGHCDRCRTVVEPRVSKQWFVNTPPLAARAIEAVTSGRIIIIPERFTRVYLNWMENIRDWCISRQLWWGHRIPVWYCSKCSVMTVSVETPDKCSKCGSPDIFQDPDVLDTWFSSGLWPHSTLGWPDDTEDLRYFYPTSVMETGYDILFFWVARMIMMGLEDTGDIPFRTVYLHGLVRDEKGDKMSKMRGNVLNPLEMTRKYGTDALRFALTTGTSPGNDISLSQQRIESGRNFANKIWNASRFILRAIEANPEAVKTPDREFTWEDRWIVSRLNRVIGGVNRLLEEYQFGEAERQIHDFFWGEFCDWYLEIAKLRLRQGQASCLPVLVSVMEIALRLLHPFMPFVTEEIWQSLKPYLPPDKLPDSIVIASYPTARPEAIDPAAEDNLEAVIQVTRSIRNARAQYRVPSGKAIAAQVYSDSFAGVLSEYSGIIESLAVVRPLTVAPRNQRPQTAEKVIVDILKDAEVVIPMAGMVDIAAERQRLEKEIQSAGEAIARLEARLKDPAFISQAPAAIVEKEKARLSEYADRLARLKQELSQLG